MTLTVIPQISTRWSMPDGEKKPKKEKEKKKPH
jgi:hypothetical protein